MAHVRMVPRPVSGRQAHSRAIRRPGRARDVVEGIGASSSTVRLNLRWTEPPELFPQMVNMVRSRSMVGVPQMVPLLGPNWSPLGSTGSIAQAVIDPEPVTFTSTGTIAVLFVAVSSVVGIVIESGTSSTMVRLNRTDTDPPELLPLNVNSVRFRSCVGVPQIVPLAEPSSRPVGRLCDGPCRDGPVPGRLTSK